MTKRKAHDLAPAGQRGKAADGPKPKRKTTKDPAAETWAVPLDQQCHAKGEPGQVCRDAATKGGRCDKHQGQPRICGARTRTPGPNGEQRYCTQNKLAVGRRCKLHGGKSPVGPESPHHKTGRWSKYLPGGTVERFNEAAADPELQTIRRHMALIDSMITGLTLMVRENKNPTVVQQKRVLDLIDQFRRLGDSEARRMAALQQNVTLAQFIGVMRVVADLIREFVTDPDQRRAAQQRLQKLLLTKDTVDGEVVEPAKQKAS